MNPAATEFVMQPSRASSSRPAPASLPSQEGRHSRCPALRAAAHSQEDQSTAVNSGPFSTAYDPVHHGHYGTWWSVPYIHPPYNTHQQPSQPRLPGSSAESQTMLAGSSSHRPTYQHTRGNEGSVGSLSSLDDHIPAPMSFFPERHSGMFLPSIGGLESSTRNRTLSSFVDPPSTLPHLNAITTPPAISSSPPIAQTATTRSRRAVALSEGRLDAVSPPSNRHTETDISESPRSATSPRTYYPPTSAYTATRTRHTHTRSHTDVSEPSSEEDGDMDPFETDVNTLLMLDGMPDLHATTEERVRAQQLLRGGLSSRRVASGKALAALERVNIPDLPENEKTCVICYNDYGVQTPEGINEVPLRLPKCKHVFGDHCIKKWFEENDTCPYCRDKVPSQPQFHYGSRTNMTQFIRAQQLRGQPRGHDSAGGSLQALLRYRPGAPAGDSFLGPSDSFVRRGDTHRAAAYSSRPRSPPSDMYESRRRTRARHGSLRGSPPIGRPISYSAGLVNIAPLTAHNQSSGRSQHQAPNHRHQASLPTLGGHMLPGTGIENPPYLLEHLLRPITNTNSTIDYSTQFSNMGMPPSLRDGPMPRAGPSHASGAPVTPLSPTISGPEIGMSGQN